MRALLLVIFAISFSAYAKNPVELGTPERFQQLIEYSDSCTVVLGGTMRATQLGFARDFLKYDAKDLKDGLISALIRHFPRVEALFSNNAELSAEANPSSLSFRLRRKGHRTADRALTSIILLQKILLGAAPKDFAITNSKLDPGVEEITRVRQIVYDYLTETSGVTLNEQVYAKVKIEKLHALIVRLVIHDQKKFEHLMNYGEEILPYIEAVLPVAREQLKRSAIDFPNLGRFFQFEAPASHIKSLASLDEQAFQLLFIKELFDVGGAKASENPEGSHWIKPILSSYLKLYADHTSGKIGSNPNQIAEYYWGNLKEAGLELGMPSSTPDELAVVRLAYLFRLNQFSEPARSQRIQALRRAVHNFEFSAKKQLFKELQKTGVEDGWAFTLGYIPQVSENIQKDLKTWFSNEEPDQKKLERNITLALNASLDVLLRTLQLARGFLKDRSVEGSGEYVLELSEVADFAKNNGTTDLLKSTLAINKSASKGGIEIVAKTAAEISSDDSNLEKVSVEPLRARRFATRVAVPKIEDPSSTEQIDFLVEEFPAGDGILTRIFSPSRALVNYEEFPVIESVESIVELANDKYSYRRTKWGQSILKRNLTVAWEYLRYSSYAEVFKNGVRVGGIRFISLPDNSELKIPEFTYLGIDMMPEDKTAIISEAGAFSNDETRDAETQSKVWFELLTHFNRAHFGGYIFRASDPVFTYDQSNHTYADLASLYLYEPLGYKPLTHYMLNGKEKDYRHIEVRTIRDIVQKIPPIVKLNDQGKPVEWWPIVFDPQDAVRLREKIASGKTRRVSEKEFLQRVPQFLSRDTSLIEYGATFEQCLQFAEGYSDVAKPSYLGLAASQGVIEGLQELDLHFEKSLSSTPRIRQKALENLKATEHRVAVFRSAVEQWLNEGKADLAANIAGLYLGRERVFHPEILKIVIAEVLPAVFSGAARSIGTSPTLAPLLLFYKLHFALSAEKWIAILKGEVAEGVVVDPKLVSVVTRALFEPAPRRRGYSPSTYNLDVAFFELMRTPNLSDELVKTVFLKGAEGAILK